MDKKSNYQISNNETFYLEKNIFIKSSNTAEENFLRNIISYSIPWQNISFSSYLKIFAIERK